MNSKKNENQLKRKLEDEHRVFQVKWEQQYFCILNKGKVLCLICQNIIGVLKEYNIKRHYEIHRKIYDQYGGKMRQDKLQEFKKKLQIQQNVFINIQHTNESVVKASYAVSHLIGTFSKPFTEGEFVKRCIIKAAEVICPEKLNDFKNISLSRNTVADGIVDMAVQLQKKTVLGEAFSIAIDESTDVTDIAQLAIYIRMCDKNIKVNEELLELVPMHDTTTSEDIFIKVQEVLSNYNVPLEKIVCIVTDGAPAMIGKKMVLLQN